MQSPDSHFNARQDAELSDVPLPEGLMERLRWTALADDEGLDEALRQVALPSGLVQRLRRSVLTDDAALDAAIRDVPIPVELPGRLRRVPKNRIRLARLTQWATAASLLIAIGLSYVGAIIGFVVATYPEEVSRPKLASSLTVRSSGPWEDQEVNVGLSISAGAHPTDEGMVADLLAPMPEVRLRRYERPGPTPLAAVSELFEGVPGDAFLKPRDSSWDPNLLGRHKEFDELPELKKVASPIPRGIDPPVVAGFNWAFYLRYGVYPVVHLSPAAHPKLRSGLVPLGVDPASYELTRRHLEDGELPPPKDIRTEEFLAAVDYGFPQPKGHSLGLSTAGGPSPFGGPGVLLLQIGVQGREVRDKQRRPARLVVTVDVSSSMRWGGRLEMVRRAMSQFAGRLGPEDRISLVAFSEEAELLIEDVGRNEADQLLAAVKSLSVESSTNLGAGLGEAYAVAKNIAAPDEGAVRVVLLTDGLTELGRGTADLIEQHVAEAAQREIFLEVIDLRQEKEPDPQLASFARSGGGNLHRATNADQVRWALLRILTGRSQLIAEAARLKVSFHPKNVLGYRLLGHEGKSMVGLLPARPEADFLAGHSATAVYEIQLKPNGGQEVAAVELSWRDPGGNSGDRRKLTGQVRRDQLASSFVQAPLSLQEAALVVEAAEVLRRSPFAPLPRGSQGRGLARVLELAGQVDTQLYQRPTFVEFMSLVKRAATARPYRSGEER